ncbi:MAG: leucine-rich repeat protein [Methanobrevibacter sp.]|nr:leucine-rich repeat protein [Methanobrevibacter sp.]
MESNYKEKLKMIMGKYPKLRECIKNNDWETFWSGLMSTEPTTLLSDTRLQWNPFWACLFMTAFAQSGIDCQLKEIPSFFASNPETARELTEIVIPEGVTTIRQSAFEDCDNLSQISIPKSIQQIGIDAFLRSEGVNYRRYITIPEAYNDPDVLAQIGIEDTDSVTFI